MLDAGFEDVVSVYIPNGTELNFRAAFRLLLGLKLSRFATITLLGAVAAQSKAPDFAPNKSILLFSLTIYLSIC